MNIDVLEAEALPPGLVALGVPVAMTADGPRLAVSTEPVAARFGVPTGVDAAWCRSRSFTGKVGQTAVVRTGGSVDEPEIVLVGTGPRPAGSADAALESLRRASAAFIRSVGRGDAAALLLPTTGPDGPAPGPADASAAAAEGASLAAYRYTDYRTGDDPVGPTTLYLVSVSDGDVAAVRRGATRGARLADSVNLARDLVNEPPSSLTPGRFADVFTERFADVPQIDGHRVGRRQDRSGASRGPVRGVPGVDAAASPRPGRLRAR